MYYYMGGEGENPLILCKDLGFPYTDRILIEIARRVYLIYNIKKGREA